MPDARFRLRQVGLLLVWLGFIAYAVFQSPPAQPNTVELIQALVLGQWASINPFIVALFNIMGLWPVIYASVALLDGRSQSFPVWPFVVTSLGLGAFALLPYLAFRRPYSMTTEAETNAGSSPSRFGGSQWVNRMESRWVGIMVTEIGAGFLLFANLKGDWGDFIHQWQTSQFIHIMSLDFCALSLLFPCLLGDDMARRGLTQQWIWVAVAIAPFIGPALYLCLRPPLLDALPTGDHSPGVLPTNS